MRTWEQAGMRGNRRESQQARRLVVENEQAGLLDVLSNLRIMEPRLQATCKSFAKRQKLVIITSLLGTDRLASDRLAEYLTESRLKCIVGCAVGAAYLPPAIRGNSDQNGRSCCFCPSSSKAVMLASSECPARRSSGTSRRRIP